MVNRKYPWSGLAALALPFLMTGCQNAGAPMVPLDSPRLVISLPDPGDIGIGPSFTLAFLFKYNIRSDEGVVKGSFDLGSFDPKVATVNIPLPKNGHWLVSGELINAGVTVVAIGARPVDVQGTTPVQLNMGILYATCYQALLADTTSPATTSDLLDLDTYQFFNSGVGGFGDLQALQFVDPTYPSQFLGPYLGPNPGFAYLGTGDWVDHTVIPPDTVFHADSLTAKQASLGPTAVTERNDIYVVKMSSGAMAWVQVSGVNNVPGAGFLTLLFRVDRSASPWMKFDVTQYGDVNCNSSGVTLY